MDSPQLLFDDCSLSLHTHTYIYIYNLYARLQLHADAIRRCNAMQRVRKVCVAHCESTDNDLGSRSADDVHRTTQGSIHPPHRLDPRSITGGYLIRAPLSLIRDNT